MRKALKCTRYSLTRLFATPRSWAVLILTWLYLSNLVDPVRALLRTEGLRCSVPGFFACLLADSQVTFLMGIGLVLMLYDAPFTDEMHLYLVVRAGRRAWARGEAIYILLTVIVYLAFALMIVALSLGPYGQYDGAWGAGLERFIVDGAYEEYDSMIDYDPWIYEVYGPWSAFFAGLGLHVLGFAALGLALFSVNMLGVGRIGWIAAALPLMFDCWIVEYLPEAWYWFSPVSLTRLTALDYGDDMGRPPLAFAWAALLILTMLLLALAVRAARSREAGKVVMR